MAEAQPDAGLEYVRSLIKSHANFPIDGVLFQDMFPILRDPKASEIVFNRMVEAISKLHVDVDVIVGLDSRGFLFGPTLATRLNAGFVPIRKKGKLPGECEELASVKEYGEDILEIQKDSISTGQKVVIVDDLIATGGTLKTAVELIKKIGGNPVMAVCVIGLPVLAGEKKVGVPVHSLFGLDADV